MPVTSGVSVWVVGMARQACWLHTCGMSAETRGKYTREHKNPVSLPHLPLLHPATLSHPSRLPLTTHRLSVEAPAWPWRP